MKIKLSPFWHWYDPWVEAYVDTEGGGNLFLYHDVRSKGKLEMNTEQQQLEAIRARAKQGYTISVFDDLGFEHSEDCSQADGDVVTLLQIIDAQQAVIDAACRLSDVGDLFDGADHLNEYTHEENEKHVTAALDKIHRIATGKEEPE